MFGKKKRGGPTLIGEGSELEGTLQALEGLQVDGTIEGTIEVQGGMSVGPKGILKGEVRADTAAVAGRVEGRFVVDGHLHLLATGHLEGEISYGTLQVETGGELSGRTAHAAAVAEEDEDEADELIAAAGEA